MVKGQCWYTRARGEQPEEYQHKMLKLGGRINTATCLRQLINREARRLSQMLHGTKESHLFSSPVRHWMLPMHLLCLLFWIMKSASADYRDSDANVSFSVSYFVAIKALLLPLHSILKEYEIFRDECWLILPRLQKASLERWKSNCPYLKSSRCGEANNSKLFAGEWNSGCPKKRFISAANTWNKSLSLTYTMKKRGPVHRHEWMT